MSRGSRRELHKPKIEAIGTNRLTPRSHPRLVRRESGYKVLLHQIVIQQESMGFKGSNTVVREQHLLQHRHLVCFFYEIHLGMA